MFVMTANLQHLPTATFADLSPYPFPLLPCCADPMRQGDGSSITVEPGLILGEVNRILAAFATKNKLPIQYKMGPDPSSIDSCMVGGVVSNNSSGMCCGVSQNTYHTLKVRTSGVLALHYGFAVQFCITW